MSIEYIIDKNLGPESAQKRYNLALSMPFFTDKRLSYDERRSTKASTVYQDITASTQYPRTMTTSAHDKTNIYGRAPIPAQNRIPLAKAGAGYFQLREHWTKQRDASGELYVLPVAGSIKLEIPRDDTIDLDDIKDFVLEMFSVFFKESTSGSSTTLVWDDDFLRALLRNNQRYFG